MKCTQVNAIFAGTNGDLHGDHHLCGSHFGPAVCLLSYYPPRLSNVAPRKCLDFVREINKISLLSGSPHSRFGFYRVSLAVSPENVAELIAMCGKRNDQVEVELTISPGLSWAWIPSSPLTVRSQY
jgi:hypothetical protein